MENVFVIDNVYAPNNKLYWVTSDFTTNNYPNTIDFDFPIKKDIVNYAKTLPIDSGIIDCGAHIGDGTIPIAHALSCIGRSDITVYAIDPTFDKCQHIKKMIILNNLSNVEVIQCGLSDNNVILYPNIPKDKNTGGTCWLKEKINTNSNAHEYTVGTPMKFCTLDSLVETKVINKPIKVIHLDVEGMEESAIRGGINTIMQYKPYLSLEDHEVNIEKFLNILPTGYTFKNRLINNFTFASK